MHKGTVMMISIHFSSISEGYIVHTHGFTVHFCLWSLYVQSDDMCMGVIYNEWQYGMSFSAMVVDVFLLTRKDEGMLSVIKAVTLLLWEKKKRKTVMF